MPQPQQQQQQLQQALDTHGRPLGGATDQARKAAAAASSAAMDADSKHGVGSRGRAAAAAAAAAGDDCDMCDVVASGGDDKKAAAAATTGAAAGLTPASSNQQEDEEDKEDSGGADSDYQPPSPTAAAAGGGGTQPPARAARGTAAAAAAPARKRAKQAATDKAGRKAASKAAAAAAGGNSDDEDADEAAAAAGSGEDAAAALAAAAAASFAADEATQINTALLGWYDRVMRTLPWRRNPHQQKPDQPAEAAAAASEDGEQGGGSKKASAAAAAAAAKEAKATSKKAGGGSKAERAAAEAAAVLAAAVPASPDLTPQEFAYHVWVSEIMLQQTQVARVIPYFTAWIAAWPTVADLAAAAQEQVNEVWAGLGYYRRARYLRDGAAYVMDTLGGRFPETAAEMRQIPGVGPYTAAAVASIAFNDPAAAVDGNVIRVLARLRALRGNPARLAKEWERLAGQLLHGERPGCHNQAMMELGATVCKPVNPMCDACPVSGACDAYKQVMAYVATGGCPDVEDAPRVTDYPEKVAKAAKQEQHVAVCVVKVLTLPGADTPEALAAAAAAAAAGGGGARKAGAAGASKAGAGAAAGKQQGSIRSFFKPAAKPTAAAASGAAPQQQQQQAAASEADLLAAGAQSHYLLVQRPATGLLAGLWEFPGVVISGGEPTPTARRAAVGAFLTGSLGVDSSASSSGGSSGVQVVHRRQLGSAVHIFSHIRQTLHAEELVLLAPSLAAVCPAAAATAADASGTALDGAAAAAAAAAGGTKKRKGAGGAEEGSGSGGSSAAQPPSMRWVAGESISQQGLTSGVRKVLAMALKR